MRHNGRKGRLWCHLSKKAHHIAAEVLEGLVGDCVFALEALLASPELNLDELEQATQDAIEVARVALRAVKAEID